MSAEAQKIKNPVSKVTSKETKPPKVSNLLSPLEAGVIDEINQARNDPQKYTAYLEEYRQYMKGTILSMPNRVRLQMIEGSPAIEDTINDLKKRNKSNSYEISGGLTRVARMQLADLLENPSLKHVGKDGSTLDIRLLRVGFAGVAVAENISQQVDSAREVLMNMIIDDGYKSRAHRKNIFSQAFKQIGIACGTTNTKNTICVVEFADTFKEK